MYFPVILLVFIGFTTVRTVQDFEAVENNWSSGDSEEGTETDAKKDAATPAPIMSVKPVPPIPPVVVSQQTNPTVVEDSSGEYEYEYYTEEEDEELGPEPQPKAKEPEPEPGSNEEGTETEEDEELGPEPQPKAKEPEPEPGSNPIKVLFIPMSGPNVRIGTILKPGGFNGLKPVAMPKQVQALPYESWAESPLSMAPKKKAP